MKIEGDLIDLASLGLSIDVHSASTMVVKLACVLMVATRAHYRGAQKESFVWLHVRTSKGGMKAKTPFQFHGETPKKKKKKKKSGMPTRNEDPGPCTTINHGKGACALHTTPSSSLLTPSCLLRATTHHTTALPSPSITKSRTLQFLRSPWP